MNVCKIVSNAKVKENVKNVLMVIIWIVVKDVLAVLINVKYVKIPIIAMNVI